MKKKTRKPGGGRKPAPGRKVNRSRSFYLYEDQVERVTPEEVRAAVDELLNNHDKKTEHGKDQKQKTKQQN